MTQEDLQMFEIFFNDIKKEENNLDSKKKYQINIKESILHITEVITNQATQEQLEKYKNTLTRVEETIKKIDETINTIMRTEEILQNVKINLDMLLKEEQETFNEQIEFIKDEIEEYSKNKSEIEDAINSNKLGFVIKELTYISECINSEKKENVIKNIEFDFNFNKTIQEEIISRLNIDSQTEDEEQNENEGVEFVDKNIENNETTNILIISEREGKVYLPYTRADIDYYMNTNSFVSEEQIINKKYIVPLSKYSNYSISRVTEGFKLMRKREKAPFGESLKYALNLIFERKLHPAIITACRKQDELDIYLACLQDNMLQLFDFFEIRFDYAPMKVRRNEKLEYFEGV